MLRKSTEPKTISEEEKDAELAEGRKNTAEAEFVLLSEQKKKLISDIESLKNEIKNDKEILQQGKSEVHSINEVIAKSKSSLKNEQQSLTEAIQLKEVEKTALDVIITHKNKQIEELSTSFLIFSQEHDFKKSEEEKEIKKLADEKATLVEEIHTLKKEKETITKESEKIAEDLSLIMSAVEKTEKQKQEVESQILTLSNKVQEQKDLIANNNNLMATFPALISRKEEEIKSLDIEIEQKKNKATEYEKQAFVILQKVDALNQKEAFIKSQYERAGIKWDPN